MISRTNTDRLTVYLVERTPSVRRRQLRLLASLDGLRVAGAGHDAQAHQTELVDLQPDVVRKIRERKGLNPEPYDEAYYAA